MKLLVTKTTWMRFLLDSRHKIRRQTPLPKDATDARNLHGFNE